jgi:Zn-finger nucleic acid-binding protein/aminoglycoside phosphotransferase (APT) family kinase protein
MAVDIGDRVGNYWLISQIGRGGMGRVFVGEHVFMGRRAAIKVLHQAGSADPDRVQRLFDEARAACRIAHPAIVDVFDCGTSAFAGPYMVMELLEGESLAQALRGNRRPPLPWIASVLAQVSDALGAAHQAGIVHRDLKPGNIFLLSDGRLKLLDFGIARLGEGNEVLPRSRTVIGTPRYMAPEQTRGEPATPAVDIYALGVIAFELLTGQAPYQAEQSRELFELHRAGAIPSARRLAPGLSPGADRVLAQALAKKPQRRYISARAFCQALLSALGLAGENTTWPLAALAWLGSGEQGLGSDIAARLDDRARPPDLPATLPGPVSAVPSARMSCPRCDDRALTVRGVGDVELDGCDACGGVWLDSGELEGLLAQSLGPEVAVASGAQSGARLLAHARPLASHGVHALTCPACDEPLVRKRVAETKLDIDCCDVCDGLWLDGGELAALQRLQAEDA